MNLVVGPTEMNDLDIQMCHPRLVQHSYYQNARESFFEVLTKYMFFFFFNPKIWLVAIGRSVQKFCQSDESDQLNPMQIKIGGFRFQLVELGGKIHFSSLLGQVAGYYYDTPKQPNLIEHTVSNTFLYYTILCSFTQSLSPNHSTIDTSQLSPSISNTYIQKKKRKYLDRLMIISRLLKISKQFIKIFKILNKLIKSNPTQIRSLKV